MDKNWRTLRGRELDRRIAEALGYRIEKTQMLGNWWYVLLDPDGDPLKFQHSEPPGEPVPGFTEEELVDLFWPSDADDYYGDTWRNAVPHWHNELRTALALFLGVPCGFVTGPNYEDGELNRTTYQFHSISAQVSESSTDPCLAVCWAFLQWKIGGGKGATE